MMESHSHNAPLRLFWWKGVPNFGDAFSAHVVAFMSGRDVVHAGPKTCEMLAVGSLLQAMRRYYCIPPEDGHIPVVWGAGLLHPVPTDFRDNILIELLRGPITAALLGIEMKRFGDPMLLAPEVVGEVPAQSDRVGVVLHHSMIGSPEIEALIASEPALELIDVRDEPLSVCRRIASCRHVISASLHGLIAADAFGIPSTWLRPDDQSVLKYHDYAASVGRPLIAPVEIDEVPAVLRGIRDADRINWSEGIARARADLFETFPAWMRATADTVPAKRPA